MSAPGTQVGGDGAFGERLSVRERLIVAPSTGVFRGRRGDGSIPNGAPVNRGDTIGALHSLATRTPVRSPFDGVLVAYLALEGERLRRGQPVAWLREGR